MAALPEKRGALIKIGLRISMTEQERRAKRTNRKTGLISFVIALFFGREKRSEATQLMKLASHAIKYKSVVEIIKTIWLESNLRTK